LGGFSLIKSALIAERAQSAIRPIRVIRVLF